MALTFSCRSKKILSVFFIILLNFLIISPVFAAPGDYTPLVKIPGVNANAGLFAYLSGIYNFIISVVGILAMSVLVYGGMRYITSAGNTASVQEAKESIESALTGLVLALISWLIFSTINKDILVLKNPGVGIPADSYGYTNAAKCIAAPGSGTANDPCYCIDNPTVKIYGTGGDCNAICASPSAYHCIKADLRIGRGAYTKCNHYAEVKNVIVNSCESLNWDPMHSISGNPVSNYEVIVNNKSSCTYPSTAPLCRGFTIPPYDASSGLGVTTWNGCGLIIGQNTLTLKITDNAGHTSEDTTARFTIEKSATSCPKPN